MTFETTEGQSGLPRYFASVFQKVSPLKCGRLDIVLSDGRTFRLTGDKPGPVALLEVKDDGLFSRLLREGDLGFSEAYLDGSWDTPDLQAFLDLVHLNTDSILDDYPSTRLVRAYERFRFLLQRNSRKGAKRNIMKHYDLGNDFYQLWLDESMTYSSAIFETGQEPLSVAQEAKYASVLDQMGADEGDHILEIGCGWGGFAEYAASKRGMRVTGLTISQAQYDYAVARIEAAGLSDAVDIQLRDYRDAKGSYDGIASIEMFEAVGEQYWPTYFNAVRNLLKPGRSATLQIITVEDWRFKSYRKSVDFVQKYIFPGGMLPGPTVLKEQITNAGLEYVKSIEFAESYSQTLRRWHHDFNDRWDDVAKLGFDDRFRRMWNFYLTSCASAFHSGVCDVVQVTLRAPATPVAVRN